MDEDLDELLRDGPLDVPDDFAPSLMTRIADLPLPAFGAAPVAASRTRLWAQWLVLAASAIVGATQLAGFMFGIWAAATAG